MGALDRMMGSPTDEIDKYARTVGVAMLAAMVFGVVVVLFWKPGVMWSALMWAGATSAIGWLLGFLFGIPRFLAKKDETTDAKAPQVPAPTVATDQPPTAPPKPKAGGVNTNLEEISDWLTKIIVGVSLVEARKIQAELGEAAMLIAKGLGGPDQVSFAYALMLYFSLSGFLGSYLLTRLYLQRALDDASKLAQ